MSVDPTTFPLPSSYKWGHVIGRVIYSIGDNAADPDPYPQARAARGKITFTPKTKGARVTDSNYPSIVLHAPVDAKLADDGTVVDALGLPGVWLPTGAYKVHFELAQTVDGHTGKIEDFDIVVTTAHTANAPLDLATAVPVSIPEGATVQTVIVPAGGLPGQVLTRSTTNGLTWADPPEDPDAAPATAAVAGFVAPTWSAPVSITTIPIGSIADGRLYGRDGTRLMVSDNLGTTWALVRDLPTSDGAIITLYDTTDGEVILVFEKGIYRTTGWGTNKATATLTKTLSAPGTSTFYQWGTDSDPGSGWATAATYVGSMPYNHARYCWLSKDGGRTWAVVYDLADHVDETGGTLADCHTHLTAIDRWAGPTPRIWFTWHRAGLSGYGYTLYSDDGGQTWTRIANARHTVGIATRTGMVFGTDENPNGIYVVPRTSDPKAMQHILAYRWDADTRDVSNYALWGSRSPDGATAYVGFISEVGFPAIAVQADGAGGVGLLAESPAPLTIQRTDGFRAMIAVGDSLVAAHRFGTAWTQMVARRPVARIADVSPLRDTGRLLGAQSHPQRSIAAGTGADASYAARTTAVGAGAQAKSTDATALGDRATATAGESVAVGASSTSGQRSVAIGYAATATGPDATAVGQGAHIGASAMAVAVGTNAVVEGSRGTAIGHAARAGALSVVIGASVVTGAALASSVLIGAQAVAEYDLSVGIGQGARSSRYGVALGQGALIGEAGVMVDRAVALGAGARVLVAHIRSVALGSLSVTSAADQIQIGARHLEIKMPPATPQPPDVDDARIYTRLLGGKHQLVVRFGTGQPIALATEA